jgi:hypothetical protein
MHTVLLVDGDNFKGRIKQVFKDAGRSRPSWHQYDFLAKLTDTLKARKNHRSLSKNSGSSKGSVAVGRAG